MGYITLSYIDIWKEQLELRLREFYETKYSETDPKRTEWVEFLMRRLQGDNMEYKNPKQHETYRVSTSGVKVECIDGDTLEITQNQINNWSREIAWMQAFEEMDE